MHNVAMAQAMQAAVKPKFRVNAVLKSKVLTDFPVCLADEYEAITRTYIRLMHETLKVHLPIIRRTIDTKNPV